MVSDCVLNTVLLLEGSVLLLEGSVLLLEGSLLLRGGGLRLIRGFRGFRYVVRDAEGFSPGIVDALRESRGRECGYGLDHGLGEYLVFHFMHLRFERLRSVVGKHGHFPLHYDGACVDFVGDHMHRSAAFRLSGFDHGLVYVGSVHALSAVGGQEGGVDVEDAALICVHYLRVEEA